MFTIEKMRNFGYSNHVIAKNSEITQYFPDMFQFIERISSSRKELAAYEQLQMV